MLMSATFLVSALLQFALALAVAALLGPDRFGTYALVLAAGVLAQTVVFEWLRLAASRFHHAAAGAALSRRLWRTSGLLALALALAGLVAAALFPAQARLCALVALLAIVNGVADLTLALLRAEFETRRFALTLLLRAALAIALVPLVAWQSHSAEVALLTLAATTLLPVLLALPALRRRHEDGEKIPEPAPLLRQLLAYSGPIVLTNGLYLGFFFALRAGVAWFGGLAMAGQFSLALEFVLKLFSTIGTALDLALFPLALKVERENGAQAALNQARTNLEVGIAVLAPMAMGLMLVAPGLEPVLVAPAFRGAFAAFVVALTPGIALYGVVQYGLHPFAQLRHRTGVLALAGAAALITGALAMLVLRGVGLSPLALGALLASAMAAAAAALWVQAGRIALPSIRFLVSLACCLALLGVFVTPFALIGFTLPLLMAAVSLGALAYAGGAFALDLAGIRTLLNARRAGAQAAQ